MWGGCWLQFWVTFGHFPRVSCGRKSLPLSLFAVTLLNICISLGNRSNVIPSDKELLACQNQSLCIVPYLQLVGPLRIYLQELKKFECCVRIHFLVHEGLLLHPSVELVPKSAIHTADFFIYFAKSMPWHQTEFAHLNSTRTNLIVLDESDDNALFHPLPSMDRMREVYGAKMSWYFVYFKRSYVTRKDGSFVQFPHLGAHEVFPFTYGVAEAYLPFSFPTTRDIEIMCTLRGGSQALMPSRRRVQEWVVEYVRVRNVTRSITEEVPATLRF